MSKKKTTRSARSKAAPASTATKPARTRAAAAASPVRTRDVTAPSNAPKAAEVAAGSVPRLPFRKPQSFTFAGVGRNDICPCGSGKKFKNCHGH